MVEAAGEPPGGCMKRSRLLALLSAPAAAVVVCGVALTGASGGHQASSLTAATASTNLLTNPGFESGLSGWTCSAADSATSGPVHAGSSALAAGATGSDDAQCTQKVSVQPSSTYQLSGYVQGAYAFIGDTGTGGTDTDAWTASASSWQQLNTSFTTGSSTTS